MSVYVDPMTTCLRNRNWPYTEACHMFADTEDELHAMGKKIGLRPEWFQNHGRLPHYDLTRAMRNRAILEGAKSVDRRFTSDFMKRATSRRNLPLASSTVAT